MRERLTAAGVQVTGWLPHDEALREMARATAYLHWTAWDGQALSLLEAMAQDTVVIASDIEPNREVLGPKQVCVTEEEAIALLRRVLTDPPVARQMLEGQHARRLRFGAQRMSEEWLSLYQDVHALEPALEQQPAVGEPEPILPAERSAQPASGVA
jgi:glycosyltransferase involved in cell wall biosynthesis